MRAVTGATETPEASLPPRWLPPTAIGLLALAAVLAARRAWLCDDAFITFRYARNLVLGNGLVFNPGERVEGYTNFLWTLWMALGLRLGAGVEAWSQLSSGACYLASLLLLIADSRRARAAALPLAALGGAVHTDWTVYATGGLETAPFTFLALLGYALATARGARGPRFGWSGLAFGLAALTRPDGVVFAAVASVYALWTGGVPAAARFALGFAALFAPHLAWRLHYYGELLPNTYQAKSAGLAWYSQGLRYVALYAARYWPLLLPLLAGAVALARRGASAGPADAESEDGRWRARSAALAAALALSYTLAIARVGGDFMFARLLIPVTPFALILLERSLLPLAERRPRLWLAAAGAALAGLAFTPSPVGGDRQRFGIVDERAFYAKGDRARRSDAAGAVLARYFEGLPVRVAFLGGEARLVYRARPRVAIESETGLTDRAIARQELTERGRVGHEKRARPAYLVDERRVHFAFHPLAGRVLGLDDFAPAREIHFDGVRGRILHWDPDLMARLRERGARFRDFPADLDRYVEGMSERTTAEVARDYEKFRNFYFAHVDDPAHEAPFRARLGLE